MPGKKRRPHAIDRRAPVAPDGYMVAIFDVLGTPERTVYPNSVEGYRQATAHAHGLAGHQVVAVAWFVEAPLDDCVAGRERLVSRYDAGKAVWGPWIAEERTGDRAKVPPVQKQPVTRRRQTAEIGGHCDVGDTVQT